MRFNRQRLSDLLKERGVSDAELAEAVGVSRQTIFFLRTGRNKTTSAEVMAKIASYLGTTIDYLLENSNGEENLPSTLHQLMVRAGRLSEIKQEELLHIAEALGELEQERPISLTIAEMRVILQIAETLKERGGNDDLLALLESLLSKRKGH